MSILVRSLRDQDDPSSSTGRGSAGKRLGQRAAQKIVAAVNRMRFLVGQDRAGHWLAVERRGLAGGIFATREAALRYAAAESDRRPGAVRVVRRPISFPV